MNRLIVTFFTMFSLEGIREVPCPYVHDTCYKKNNEKCTPAKDGKCPPCWYFDTSDRKWLCTEKSGAYCIGGEVEYGGGDYGCKDPKIQHNTCPNFEKDFCVPDQVNCIGSKCIRCFKGYCPNCWRFDYEKGFWRCIDREGGCYHDEVRRYGTNLYCMEYRYRFGHASEKTVHMLGHGNIILKHDEKGTKCPDRTIESCYQDNDFSRPCYGKLCPPCWKYHGTHWSCNGKVFDGCPDDTVDTLVNNDDCRPCFERMD